MRKGLLYSIKGEKLVYKMTFKVCCLFFFFFGEKNMQL